MKMPPDAVITGSWGDEPIWRYKTPEERLIGTGISKETADLGIALLGNRNGTEAIMDF